MKKFTIIGVILVALGGIIFTSGMFLADWDLNELSTNTQYEQVNKTFDGNNQNINIDIENADIIIDVSEDDNIHLEYFENEENKYIINESENNITITFEDYREWHDYVGNVDFSNHYFKISLPKDHTGNIDANTHNGGLDAVSLNIDSLSFYTNNGNVSLDNSNINTTIIEATNGNINIKNSVSTNLTVDTINGEISSSKLKSEVIMLDTVNGAIKCSFIGDINDYRIESSSVLGSNNLSNQGNPNGPFSLWADTVNGAIHVVFE